MTKVAIVEIGESLTVSLAEALRLIGGIEDMNRKDVSVTMKVGIYSHKAQNHASPEIISGIIDSLPLCPRITLAESDNYCAGADERLRVYGELFSERAVPENLSSLLDPRTVTLAGEDMSLSGILFPPNKLVSTHVLRTFARGSVLKNLFGCVPERKKSRYHKILPQLLADLFEVLGGVDLAVLDGTYMWRGAGDLKTPASLIVAGRDAVAVETVGGVLAGLKPEKMPVLREFVKRGLGEGDVRKIEIAGIPLESLREKTRAAVRVLDREWKERGGAPKSWAPAVDGLIEKGFFASPHRRTIEDVEKAMRHRGIKTEGNRGFISTTLKRRVKKGFLKARKTPLGWLYWTR